MQKIVLKSHYLRQFYLVNRTKSEVADNSIVTILISGQMSSSTHSFWTDFFFASYRAYFLFHLLNSLLHSPTFCICCHHSFPCFYPSFSRSFPFLFLLVFLFLNLYIFRWDVSVYPSLQDFFSLTELHIFIFLSSCHLIPLSARFA